MEYRSYPLSFRPVLAVGYLLTPASRLKLKSVAGPWA